VNRIGHTYYDQQDLQIIHEKLEESNIDLYLINEKPINGLNELEGLFDRLENINDILNERPVDYNKAKDISFYGQFLSWTNNLRIAAIAGCDIPTYDYQANESLRSIINDFESTKVITNES
jgi:hypothetical protein